MSVVQEFASRNGSLHEQFDRLVPFCLQCDEILIVLIVGSQGNWTRTGSEGFDVSPSPCRVRLRPDVYYATSWSYAAFITASEARRTAFASSR
jgi:hypothetical protein